jgi:hypothetical protein
MIQNLLRALPESRRTSLRKELALLDQAIEGCYVVPEDIALARIADTQGLGGAHSVADALAIPIVLDFPERDSA